MKPTIIVKGKIQLKNVIQQEIELHGNECDLNHIDVSLIRKMDGLFQDSEFNGDISNWDVANVLKMVSMFRESLFLGDLSNWRTYNLSVKDSMFADCSAPIPYWYELGKIPRKSAIDAYHLRKELNGTSEINSSLEKKVKI